MKTKDVKRRECIDKIEDKDLEITDKQKDKMLRAGNVTATAEKYGRYLNDAVLAGAQIMGYTAANGNLALAKLMEGLGND